jgi:hypothetical protein
LGTSVLEEHAASIFWIEDGDKRILWITLCQNPEDHNMNCHHCENLKSYTSNFIISVQFVLRKPIVMSRHAGTFVSITINLCAKLFLF